MQSVKRVSLTDNAINEIKKYLLSGKIKPGDKIMTEKELSEHLNVGRSTVREALRTLKAIGYIDIIPGRGAFAVITSEEENVLLRSKAITWIKGNEIELKEYQELRMCIEPFAAKLATKNITDNDIGELKKILDRFEKAFDSENYTDLALYDELFHSTIIKASKNRLLHNIFKQTVTVFKQYSAKSFLVIESVKHTHGEHKAIYEALKSRDSDGAEQTMIAHLLSTIRHMEDIVNKN
ncbi:MAG: FadR family transcriptional regulator [Clostridiales bacterium]|nr:FadR family transcriptional regulator [Clostridiales bacterium]